MAKPLNLPWNQADSYWICVLAGGDAWPVGVAEKLGALGMVQALKGGPCFLQRTPKAWVPHWQRMHDALGSAASAVEIALVAGEGQPDAAQIASVKRSAADMQSIAGSMWLADAVAEDRLICHMQPVVTAPGKPFGYESFARVQADGGKLIGGGEIVSACRTLRIEYMIDRQLHVQAIKSFVASELAGFLFVNFFTGFIQRPEVYLEGLTEAARSLGLISKYIVLELTKSENQKDFPHMKKVCEYCRSKGYSIALDDVISLEQTSRLISEIRPDFIRIDRKLAMKVATPAFRTTIEQIVAQAHGAGGTVIGEGVETEEVYLALKSTGVDLFQGYFFSPPVAVEELVQKSKQAG